MNPLLVSGNSLQVDEVVAVARGRPVKLDPQSLPLMNRSRQAVEQIVREGRVAYGITTGFGRFKDKIISPDEVRELQLNLVRSHAAGVGPELSQEEVRAMLLIRANTLAIGHSGVRPELVQLLLDMLNAGIHPRVPSQGSLGASGDLAPLAHLALVLIGEGEAHFAGDLVPGAEALRRANLTPLSLRAKEGLALLNGTTLMVALGALNVRRAINLTLTADIVAALTLEALNGTDRAFDDRVHQLRPHPRQIDSAQFLRRVLQDSRMLRGQGSLNVQDPYTLRCLPQVHGAVRDAIAYAHWVINIELNSVNDNPIILVDEQSGEIDVISAGNFHGEPISIAMDYSALAMTEMGNMSERRVARLVNADSNGGILPMFLTKRGGLESGFMLAQYTAAALASESKVLAHPASADTIPSSADVEDHVSMGPAAVRQFAQILRHSETIVAIELLCAAQGIDFRLRDTGQTVQSLGCGTRVAYQLIRDHVPFQDKDMPLAPQIEQARALVVSGAIKTAVEESLRSA
jgi:histidine ammonia-lyase